MNDVNEDLKNNLPPYLELLNPEQKAAVLHTGKPLLILAGAGSGKTRVITTKIAYLIREKGIEPSSILAVTFTNKAAQEMAERAKLIDARSSYAMLRTFHSFGAWFLRRNSALAGLSPNFTIYDDDDTVSLLSLIMKTASKLDVKRTAHHIARAKDYFLSPDASELNLIDYRKEFRTIYFEYEERLKQTGNVDFGDLIKKPVEILQNYPEVSKRFHNRFKVIMVDEYQDSNIAQFELLKELCGPQSYLCVVGDDDQSIYRFRGAEVQNILEFPDRFSETDIIRLERNYRSTSHILNAASSVVAHNTGRLGKTLIAERGEGKKPEIVFLSNQDEEAKFCAELIAHSVYNQRASFSDWAVLYRTNAQSLGFETEFMRRNIPYRVVGSLKFYEREEIKDALALLAFLVNPKDEIAFRRIVNKPARGIGSSSVGRISAAAGEVEGDLALASKKVLPALSAKAQSGIKSFFNIIEVGRAALNGESLDTVYADENEKRKDLSAGEGLSECVVRLIKDSGLDEYHLLHDETEGTQRINNLQELANTASLYPATYDGLSDFLEHIELARSFDEKKDVEEPDTVTLITLHNTKGLEFRRVIMTGIEQGIFPREDKKDEELEEERRLFYVGATRAMDELYFSCSALRRMHGRTLNMEPSLFLHEMDKSNIRILGAPPNNSVSRSPYVKKKSINGWTVADRVFNDDQGYGYVTDLDDGDDGFIIQVTFDTGKKIHFLNSGRLTRIGNDGY